MNSEKLFKRKTFVNFEMVELFKLMQKSFYFSPIKKKLPDNFENFWIQQVYCLVFTLKVGKLLKVVRKKYLLE